MKFIAAPALLATTAYALGQFSLKVLNTDPPGVNLTIGTDYVLRWTSPDAKPNDTFRLTFSATNETCTRNPILGLQCDNRDVDLGDVKFSDESYTFKIKPIDDKGLWTGDNFLYDLFAYWDATTDIFGTGFVTFHVVH
ncbi:hypothetical protein EV127DRAFT_482203 [Xylaria flabelliformis]|nr:hypothetical protein EV127DRAFT_482203 [Xylaria flabelliformis]KAI0858311.1 hypothetical protein F4860DRAFT_486884 [Xylaria cubensis]